MFRAQYKLEQYFAQNYKDKYIEFDGIFHDLVEQKIGKTKMEKYFHSGKYKELNDKKLEELWRKARIEANLKRGAVILLLLVILIWQLN